MIEATTAVLLVARVGSAAELSTNRSSFAPAAMAGEHAVAAVARTRSVCKVRFMSRSHPKKLCLGPPIS
jgi:hypothetical protein